MRTIAPSDLRARIEGIFSALGAVESVAQQVAWSLVESNLAGHDSHGVIRVPWYVRAAQEGQYHPNAEIRVVRESAATALLDCGYTYGQVSATRGMELAIEKLATLESIFEEALEKGKRLGHLPADFNTALNARYLINIWNGINVTRRMYPSKQELEPMLKMSLNMLP